MKVQAMIFSLEQFMELSLKIVTLIFLLTKSVDLPILQRPEEDNFRYRGSHGFGMRMFMRVNRCFKSVQYTEEARQNRQPACATARGTPPSRTVLTSG
jgi:hypothetical protein